jgi:uncharacterized protein (TIGR02466 family)
MSGKLETLFPTFLYSGKLARARVLNREFKKEISQLEDADPAGRKWSSENYIGGYSSYSSECRLHKTSPNFSELEAALRPHVARYAKALNWDLMDRKLEMTTCWANAMGEGTYHTMHTHPHCALSGVYYVSVPKHSSPLKIEDPRLGFLMAAPPRKSSAPRAQRGFVQLPAVEGGFLLFESWLRHEVPPHRGVQPRLSVSFNYEWF